MKRIVSCLLAVLLAISVSAHAYGVELILKEQIYQEKGQIELNGLKLSIDDNNEIIIGGNDISARKLLLS